MISLSSAAAQASSLRKLAQKISNAAATLQRAKGEVISDSFGDPVDMASKYISDTIIELDEEYAKLNSFASLITSVAKEIYDEELEAQKRERQGMSEI